MGNAGWADSGKTSLPLPTIIGIVFGCVFGSAAILLVVYCCCCRGRKHLDPHTRSPSSNAASVDCVRPAVDRSPFSPSYAHDFAYAQGCLDEAPQPPSAGNAVSYSQSTVRYVVDEDDSTEYGRSLYYLSAPPSRGANGAHSTGGAEESARTVSVSVSGAGFAKHE